MQRSSDSASDRRRTDVRKTIAKAVLLAASIAITAAAFIVFDIDEIFRPDVLRMRIEMAGALGPFLFIGIYILATVLFLPATPLSVISGVLFGAFLGSLYTLVGATIGASLAFFVSRRLGRSFVDKLMKNKLQKVFAYNQKLEEHGFLAVLFLRLLPLFPFNGLNFALGLTKVKYRDYLLGTLLGIAPAVFVFAYFGDSLATLGPVQLTAAATLLVFLIAGPVIYTRYRRSKGKNIIPDFSGNNKNER